MKLSKAELEQKLKSGKELLYVNKGSRGKVNILATLNPTISPGITNSTSRQAIEKPEKYIEVWNIKESRWSLIHLKQIEMVGKLRTNGIRA